MSDFLLTEDLLKTSEGVAYRVSMLHLDVTQETRNDYRWEVKADGSLTWWGAEAITMTHK